jgi:predicted chitinase
LLAIDKLSQQGGTQQSTKGQNLNSVYLTRSYTCTIESFGNMMIQPMTYFDLIGVPMFNGAYLITEVKHSFKSNNASTTFKGVRQPRATIPIVTDAALAMSMSFKEVKGNKNGTGKSISQGTQTKTNSSPTPTGTNSIQAINATGAVGKVSANKKPIIDLIINTAVGLGIKDKNRLIALLTVGQAEGGFTIRNESFNYTPSRYREVFGGYPTVKGKSDDELKLILPKTKGCPDCTGSEKTAANNVYNVAGCTRTCYNAVPTALSPDDGYNYRGRGLTQITFKSNYRDASINLDSYFPGINLVDNPEKALDEDVAVKMLVVLKLKGQFGSKLDPGINYMDQVYNIISMQDGGSSMGKKSNAAVQVYANALATVKSDTYIQEKLREFPDFIESGSAPSAYVVRTGRGPKETDTTLTA